MSTYTENYGLKKPEMTDNAQLSQYNESWDKVDELLKDLENAVGDITPEGIGARPDTWMPTAADVGALKVYGSFSELGLAESSATADSIVTAMDNNSMLLCDCSNTATSATLKFPATYGLLKVIKKSNNYAEFEYRVGSNVWYGYYNKVATTPWIGWIQHFKSDGGVPMTGSLKTFGEFLAANGYNQFGGNNEVTVIGSYKTIGSTTGRRWLGLWNESLQKEYALKFGDSSGASYNIFGEHNKELLASTLETLMSNGGMSTLQSAIQVTNSVLSSTSATFTGTGKGRLFIASGSTVTGKVTIDGKEIGTGHGISNFEVEFLQSFSVQSTSSNGLYCTAVFY